MAKLPNTFRPERATGLEVLEKENVQLVISDIMMPVMDGIELCKK
jgi:CheY-like chemotaxis protein